MRHLRSSKDRLLTMTSAVALIAASVTIAAPARADDATDRRWIDSECQPSTLSKADQLKELQWFEKAAQPFKGMEINVVSETIATHEYESRTLAKAFSEITGIKLKHDLLQEGDVVEKLQTQIQTVPDKKLYQLPDQQFANLYWFRYDWFSNPDYKAKFKAKYGYDLGVPVNWSAYEDIAEFFTNDIKEINGVKVYGHMDYGKKDPSLGWRFTDAWLSMAGNGDKGIPNGKPVDEWGIRMEGCRPVGSSAERGGDTNGPAAVYSIVKYVDWLNKYAPPNARGMTFSEAGAVPAQGNIAQQIFWYTAFTADMVKPGLPG